MSKAMHTELRLAQRMSRLGTETAFEVLAKARALEAKGHNIVHLEIGEPDFDTPANIVDAAVNALHRGFTHYGPSAGMPELRKAIADEVGSHPPYQGVAGRGGRGSGWQADHLFHHAGAGRGRRRGDLSESGLSHL